MSGIDCGDCTRFLAIAVSYYEPILLRHEFQFVECRAERGGRECLIMYSNARASLLFMRSDGADSGAIGDASLPFPRNGWTGEDGRDGWYSLVGLVEYLRGKKKLLTPKLIDEFVSGKRAYLDWESANVADRMGELIDLFDPGRSQRWREDFAAYRQTRRYG